MDIWDEKKELDAQIAHKEHKDLRNKFKPKTTISSNKLFILAVKITIWDEVEKPSENPGKTKHMEKLPNP